MDRHYLPLEFPENLDPHQTKLSRLLAATDYPGRQFFIVQADGDARTGAFSILELHLPGQSPREKLENTEIVLNKKLFFSYHIW